MSICFNTGYPEYYSFLTSSTLAAFLGKRQYGAVTPIDATGVANNRYIVEKTLSDSDAFAPINFHTANDKDVQIISQLIED